MCDLYSCLVLNLFPLSTLTWAFQLFTRKHCLQIVGLKMRSVTWNRFPILKNLLMDSNPSPLWRLVTWIVRFQILQIQLSDSHHNLTKPQLEKLSDEAHGYVGADLAAVCTKARLRAVMRHSKQGNSRKNLSWEVQKRFETLLNRMLLCFLISPLTEQPYFCKVGK